MGKEKSRQDHIKTQFDGKRIRSETTGISTFNGVKSQRMTNLHYLAIATALVVTSTSLINTPADAHQKYSQKIDEHHHGHRYSNQKQKAFNRGYRKGYNKAYKNSVEKQYKYHNPSPVYYQPRRRPVVIAPGWRIPQPVIIHPNHYQYSHPYSNLRYSFVP